MAEYIEREFTIKQFEEWASESKYAWVKSVKRKLQQIPAADVRPERRGRWIKDSGGTIICSECGEEHEWETYRASYCDTCGAKMSWEDDE